jgi:hypothetical protein
MWVDVAECEYPPCSKPAAGERGLVVQPEPIGVSLCAYHLAMVDRNGVDGARDFWRWATAMMQSPGAG